MGNKRYQRMAPYRRKEGAMNGKQALPEDGALQRERGRYKSAHTVIAKRAARGWLDCWHATSTSVVPIVLVASKHVTCSGERLPSFCRRTERHEV